jgi:phage virion morphogenesis protein
MAGATIKVEVDDALVQQALSRVARIASDARPLFTEIGSALEASTRERFDQGKGPDGVAWVDLKPATRRRKRNPKILVERGDLLASIGFEAGPDFVQIVAGPTQYAATHQFGRPDAGIPARPYLGLSEDDMKEIDEAAGDYVARHLAP